jgi:hypothetical protein
VFVSPLRSTVAFREPKKKKHISEEPPWFTRRRPSGRDGRTRKWRHKQPRRKRAKPALVQARVDKQPCRALSWHAYTAQASNRSWVRKPVWDAKRRGKKDKMERDREKGGNESESGGSKKKKKKNMNMTTYGSRETRLPLRLGPLSSRKSWSR